MHRSRWNDGTSRQYNYITKIKGSQGLFEYFVNKYQAFIHFFLANMHQMSFIYKSNYSHYTNVHYRKYKNQTKREVLHKNLLY